MIRLLNNKKGFTLVEILAVIVLISLIIIIAVPSVKSISVKSRKKLFDTKVQLAEDAVNLWGINNKTCFELESAGCSVLDNCYIESNIYTCETTFGKLAQHGIINYDEEYKGVRYVVNPIDSGSMNDFKLLVTLNNNNKIVNTDFDDEDESVKFVPIDRDETTETTSSSGSASNQVVKYSVVYWLQNVGAGTAENSSNYEKTKTEEKEGISGKNVTPEVSLYTGFNSPEPKTVTIKSDGSTVVNYYYTRNSYTVTLNKGTGISSVSGAGTYQYGQSVTINATVSSGYTWNKWSGTHSITTQEFTFTMPAYNVTDTATAKKPSDVAQAIYSADNNSLTFVYRPYVSVGNSFSYVDENGATQTITATAVYTNINNTNYAYAAPWFLDYASVITRVYVADEGIKPISTSFWFYQFTDCEYINLKKIDTSSVKNMSFMFSGAGTNVATFEIVGLDNWDTSTVTDMSYMFSNAGKNATTWNIGDLSNWNTSRVADMTGMFGSAGYNAITFNIGDLSGWNTSEVTDMSGMFVFSGHNATMWDIGDLNNWNTSKVTNMSDMFEYAGYKATSFDIGDLSSWDTSEVTDMSGMFQSSGSGAITWDIGNLSNWDTSTVTDMSYMFSNAGKNATTWNIGDLSSWSTSKVTDMTNMFRSAGKNATTWDIGNLSNWDTSIVTDMSYMFYYAGYKATSFDIGDLSSWSTSKVTNMSDMFEYAGYKATSFDIGDLSSWDTSIVTDMSYMFYYAGYTASYSLDLSSWDVSNVTSYKYFNSSVSTKVIAPSFGTSA